MSADSFHEDDVVGKAVDLRLLKRLWKFIRPHRGWLWFSTLSLVVVSALDLLPTELVKRVVDGPVARFQETGDAAALTGDLARVAALFGGALLLAFLLRAAQMIAINTVGQRTMLDLRTAVFAHVQRQPLSFYDRNPVGRLVTRVVHDVESLNEVLTSGVDAIFHDVLKLTAIVGLMLWIQPTLACITFVVLPPMFWVAHVFRTSNRSAFREVRGRVSALNAYLQESVTGIRILQLFGREKRAAEGFHGTSEALMRGHLQTVFNYAYFFPAIEILSSVAKALLLWYGGRLVAEATLSPGALDAFTPGMLLQFLLLLDFFFEPIRDVSEKYNLMQAAMASSERIFKVLDATSDLNPPENPEPMPEPARGEIEFDNVSFGYVAGEPVLRNVSFRIRPGEKVAVVGATGAGKTTLTSLLTRLYDVKEGAVRVDGVDVRRADPAALRKRIAVVLQDVFLFAGDIEGNITLGDASVTRERVVDAAKAVHAHGFIETMENGYATQVHERGATLSVGQKQLLSFARALARDPAILVLDEATSSVDSTTEALVQDAVEKLLRGRTALVVAHRLSTIRSCDRILVFHDGSLREEGSHAELMAMNGLYARLYRLQFAVQEKVEKA